jgi:hypothetical protein
MELNEKFISNLLVALPEITNSHSPGTKSYEMFDSMIETIANTVFGKSGNQRLFIDGVGDFIFPYFSMGQIDSANLFRLDEIIIFSYYLKKAQNNWFNPVRAEATKPKRS